MGTFGNAKGILITATVATRLGFLYMAAFRGPSYGEIKAQKRDAKAKMYDEASRNHCTVLSHLINLEMIPES